MQRAVCTAFILMGFATLIHDAGSGWLQAYSCSEQNDALSLAGEERDE